MEQTQTNQQNTKAINVAYSWLLSWGLNVVPAADNVLIVEGKRVGVEPTGVDICLDATRLNSKNAGDAIDECKRVTDAIGKGKPTGTRDAPLVNRAASGDYEAASMRLTPFSRTANPPDWLLKKYEPVVKREADCAYRKYRSLCYGAQVDAKDLWSIGMVFLVVYLHRYQDLMDEQRNGANLCQFLRQEYSRWATVTCKRQRNVSFSSIGVPVEEIIGVPIAGADVYSVIDYEGKEEGFDRSHPTLTIGYWPKTEIEAEKVKVPKFRSEKARKKYENKCVIAENRLRASKKRAAIVELADRLDSMTHEEYIFALTSVIRSAFQSVDAQKAARSRMKNHAKTCQICIDAMKKLSER